MFFTADPKVFYVLKAVGDYMNVVAFVLYISTALVVVILVLVIPD